MTFKSTIHQTTKAQVPDSHGENFGFFVSASRHASKILNGKGVKQLKKLFTLVIASLFVIAQTSMSFAAVALSDKEMDGITAGDWVVLKDANGDEFVVDVYKSNNTLDLQNDSQTYLQAVSNANVVDSAVAVQTNIASVTGNEASPNVAINSSNAANILNYNPADSSYESSSSFFAKKESKELAGGSSEDVYFNYGESSSSSYGYDETLVIDETLDISHASASAESTDCSKGCEGESVSIAVLLVDYDKDIDYSKNKSASSSHSKNLTKTYNSASFFKAGFEKSIKKGEKSESSSRNNHGENNHINLEDHSQQFLQAVSNLNSVGSAAAVQTNIASNVGVGGSITHSNIATVVNGL